MINLCYRGSEDYSEISTIGFNLSIDNKHIWRYLRDNSLVLTTSGEIKHVYYGEIDIGSTLEEFRNVYLSGLIKAIESVQVKPPLVSL